MIHYKNYINKIRNEILYAEELDLIDISKIKNISIWIYDKNIKDEI